MTSFIILARLYLTFFKTGLFTIGGGLAALPLLQEEALKQGWFTVEEFFNMVAISQSTPGPIGINMASYAGWNLAGPAGSLTAALGLVSPSVIIILLVARFFFHFNEKAVVQAAFGGMRPAVAGLIASAAWNILTTAVIPLKLYLRSGRIMDLIQPRHLLIFTLLALGLLRWKLHPLFYVTAGAIMGIFLL